MEFEHHTVWEEEPVGTARLPEPVRAAAVRAVLIGTVALIEAIVVLLLVAGHSWLTVPMLLFTVLTSVIATWAVLDVWVTRQVWNQRAGVVSSPSSAARALRRERRRAGRRARAGVHGRDGHDWHIPRPARRLRHGV
jgi:hypothetical protein